ncbi:hypothetical protein PG996_009592 [Apiospora saccharicola]|uniref:Myb-like domain-containing protein n=1 Tax=Apiospora saccharicola TaxID=335842 RepID=A0ABR1ULV9_9PEZI
MASDSEGAYEPSDSESVASGASGTAPEKNQPPPGLASSSRRVHDTPETATPQYAQSPRKRRATNQETNVPLKRMRNAFNAGYLDLLNQDISDAAAAAAVSQSKTNSRLALEPSQIGAVYWRAPEKEAFFSALGRLGRDDHAGIAARIGSKSPLEVAQFVTLLSERDKARKDDRASWREALRPVGITAAAEISHECCVALDGVADDLSVRQEAHEQALEEKRWGVEHWLITQSLVGAGAGHPADATATATTTTRKLEGELGPFANLFVLPNWLRLSERVFMNSTVPECNWRHVSEEPPAIRATALSDFHELARSVTRRLVATTLFMSESRIKARRAPASRAKQAVKARDVQAAVESLNLKSNSHNFWARAARRLRLDVQGDDDSQTDDESRASSSSDEDEDEATDNEDEADQESSDEDHALSYDEVEAAFGIAPPGRHMEQPRTELSAPYVIDEDETSSSEDETKSAAAPVGENEEDEEEEQQQQQEQDVDLGQQDLKKDHSDSDGEPEKPDGRNPSLDQVAIDRDVAEVINFSAEVVETTRARDGIRNRVTAEHVMEAEAEEADARYSAREEAQLWNIIKQQQLLPPLKAAAVKREKSSDYERDGGGKAAAAGFTNRATMEPTARSWRDGFRYIAEWETYGTFPHHET